MAVSALSLGPTPLSCVCDVLGLSALEGLAMLARALSNHASVQVISASHVLHPLVTSHSMSFLLDQGRQDGDIIPVILGYHLHLL